jgi:hypothetical protein
LIASTLEGSHMVSRLQKKEKPRDLAVRHLEEYLETNVRARKSKARADRSRVLKNFPRRRTSGNAQKRTTFPSHG